MSDICDQADEVIEHIREQAIANIPRYTGISAKWCGECGEDIPEGRRLAIPGVRLCTGCAELAALVKSGVRRL